MTTPVEPDGDRLDDAIERAVAGLTAIEDFEGPARERLHRRLRASTGSAVIPRSYVWVKPWIGWTAAAALVVVAVALGLTLRETGPVPAPSTARSGVGVPSGQDRAHDDGAPTTRPGREASLDASSAAPRAPRVTGDGSRRASAGTAVRHASRPHPRSPLTAQPERLADLVRALQQLPPEVWERVETAGPPVVVHLEVGEAAPLSPLSIDPLAGAELSPADSAASDVSPGGYR